MLRFARPSLRLCLIFVASMRDSKSGFAQNVLCLRSTHAKTCAILHTTLQDRKLDHVRLMLRPCSPIFDFAQPILRRCATNNAHYETPIATLQDPCRDFGRPKMRLFVNHVATSRDPLLLLFAVYVETLQICKFARHIGDIARSMFRYERYMLRLPAKHVATFLGPGWDFSRHMRRRSGTYVATFCHL